MLSNESILLNSTVQGMVDSVNQENALLALLAGEYREPVYSSIRQIASIVRQGYGPVSFPIGDQLIIPWKDMDDTKHNTDETAYPVAFDILTHRPVELEDGEVVPGMFIGWHLCSPYGIQFSNYQAFYNAKTEALPAGTYNVTHNSVTYQFTLTQDVPKGGRISGFEGGFVDGKTVKSWATPADASPMETVTATIGSEGTSLGTINTTTRSNDGLNCQQRISYGHNRYSVSAIRQYINGMGLNWWSSKDDFDIRPNEHVKHGFLSGFGDDFLSAIKPVKVRTALNTVEGFTETEDVTYDRFFLPSKEELFNTPQIAGVEGPFFEYWKRRLGRASPTLNHPSTYDEYKIAAVNSASPQHVRLRSARRGYASNAWHVNSSGSIDGGSAYGALRFAPVCVIC